MSLASPLLEARLSTIQATARSSLPIPEDEAIGRAALRKASLRLLPLFGIGYLIAYMDRVNVSFAALQMNHALHFSASVYGLGAGLFFLSYAACEVPSNLLLVRFGARRWLARIMLTWGLISMAMLFVRTPREFYLARLALGAAEAGFFPGVIFYLSQWFPAEKLSQAISRFYIALPLSSVVMGALAGTLLDLQGHLHLAGWQWLFFIEGLPAILMGLLFLYLLPDDPNKAAWLNVDQRSWLLRNLQHDAANTAAAPTSHNLSRAFREPRVWLLGTFFLCLYICSYGYTFIAPMMIQQATNYGNTRVGLIVVLFGILGAIAMLLSGWHSDRAGERYFHTLVPTIVMAIAFVVVSLTLRPVIFLPAFGIIVLCLCSFQPPAWALPSTFLHGKSAAIGIAAVNTVAICGGFVGPWWLGIAHDLTGSYQRGLLTLAVPALVGSAIILVIRRHSKAHSSQQ